LGHDVLCNNPLICFRTKWDRKRIIVTYYKDYRVIQDIGDSFLVSWTETEEKFSENFKTSNFGKKKL